MNVHEAWEKALKTTEFVRPRVQTLLTFAATRLPYVFLAESALNQGDTVVRKGEVLVEKPSLILPYHHPQFQGFDFDKADIHWDTLTNFLLVRGVSFPSMKYNNQTASLDLEERALARVVRQYSQELQRTEDVHTCLFTGEEDVWQFAVLLYVSTQVARSANQDITRLLEEYKRKHPES